MKLNIHMYVAQPQKGHYEVSIPWVSQLAQGIKGPSPAQLKEEMMFRLLELVHGGMSPAELDRLIPPESPYLTSMYMEIERQVEVDRPPVRMYATTHIVVGSYKGDDVTRLWLPKVPGTCLALAKVDDMYAMVNHWVRSYADDHMLSNLETLHCNYIGGIEAVEVDLGFPSYHQLKSESGGPKGRLARPETLQQVATNLSHRAEDDSLNPAFGRENMIEDLMEVFTSNHPSNICLIGPSGVGKTALVHEAARRAWALSKTYQERRDVWQSSGDRVIAGMSIIGQWEQRTEAICRELAERKDILFAEDLLGLVRAGRTYSGESNVARFIEPYLEQDQFAVITEATEETYAIARSMAPGFVDKFRRVQVDELSYRDTLAVVSELIRGIEGHYDIRFTADGVETLLNLARRFFKQDAFPGKAVRLVKQCQYDALRVQNELGYGEEILVDPEHVARVVHRQTGLPMTILRPGTGRTPELIERQFRARIFGQPDAIEAVKNLVLSIEQGLTDPDRPLGSFLLIGPSGVGKTETAKALAEDLFGSRERMIRFDMSEFNESIAISRLIGTTRSPDGELTSKVRLQPFCVLLFDEIEKAHPLVLDLLLQILGDGRLTDAAGRIVDFRNAIIIMTSNLGAGTEDRWLGFTEANEHDRHLHYRRAAESFFRPEIFNRIDKVIPYRPLGPESLRKIARRTLQNLLERRGLRQAQVMVDVDEGLIDYLAEKSVDSRYGARTLAHRIERLLISPLAEQLSVHDPSVGLTRVIMTPEGEGVGLELETLQTAPVQAVDPILLDDVGTEPEELVETLSAIQEGVDALLNDPRRDAVQAEYDGLLEQINKAAADGDPTSDFAEALRLRESFISRLDTLERRVQGLLDPRGTGEFLFAPAPEEKKSKTHHIAKIARQLRRQQFWLQTQLDSLANPRAHGATLTYVGLSGPFGDYLKQWHRWLQALAQTLELDMSFNYRVGEKWQGDAEVPSDFGMVTAVSCSSPTPGFERLAALLSGYSWNPRPASEGQHALIFGWTMEGGTSNAGELLARMRNTQMKSREPGAYVEFMTAEGQFEDLRLGVKRTIPEDRGQNLENLFLEIVIARLATPTDSALGSSESE